MPCAPREARNKAAPAVTGPELLRGVGVMNCRTLHPTCKGYHAAHRYEEGVACPSGFPALVSTVSRRSRPCDTRHEGASARFTAFRAAYLASRAPGRRSKNVPTCILAGFHATPTRLSTDAAVLVFLGMPLTFFATPSARLRAHVYYTPDDLSVRSSKSSGDPSCNVADIGAV
jgi:hypothetical protein